MASWLVLLLVISALSVSATPPEKPGKCIGRAFTRQACVWYETRKLCNSDGDCRGTKKCCRTARCVTKCEEPAAPKPGVCPEPSRVQAGNSDRCDEDTDCGELNNEKCCKNAQGHKRCAKPKQKEKPGKCIRRVFIALACEPREIIQSCKSDGDCRGTKKCCQTARCVTSCEEPAAPKPGICPEPSRVQAGNSNRCDEDTDCGELNNEKCCKNAQGFKRCSKPKQKEKPGKCIARFFIALACEPREIIKSCNSDGDCRGTKKCCRTSRCVTSCEEPAAPKPGVCPEPSWVQAGNSNRCDEDTDCGELNNEKCCKNVQGFKRCSKPKGKDKPGKCIARYFIALQCGPVIQSCKSDGDCRGTKKCCRTARCVTSCEEPAGPKPGQCPHPSRVDASSFSHCDVDTDCGASGDKKCCKNARGAKRCAKPRGTCPVAAPGIGTICVVKCSSDADCSSDTVCCNFGCMIDCLKPVK